MCMQAQRRTPVGIHRETVVPGGVLNVTAGCWVLGVGAGCGLRVLNMGVGCGYWMWPLTLGVYAGCGAGSGVGVPMHACHHLLHECSVRQENLWEIEYWIPSLYLTPFRNISAVLKYVDRCEENVHGNSAPHTDAAFGSPSGLGRRWKYAETPACDGVLEGSRASAQRNSNSLYVLLMYLIRVSTRNVRRVVDPARPPDTEASLRLSPGHAVAINPRLTGRGLLCHFPRILPISPNIVRAALPDFQHPLIHRFCTSWLKVNLYFMIGRSEMTSCFSDFDTEIRVCGKNRSIYSFLDHLCLIFWFSQTKRNRAKYRTAISDLILNLKKM